MSETVEFFTHARPTYSERLAKLAGVVGQLSASTGGGIPQRLPDAHALAASLAMARCGRRDIGPEIVASIYCGTDLWRSRIVSELVSAWMQTVRAARHHAQALPVVAGHSYEGAVYGGECNPLWADNLGIKKPLYSLLVELGTGMLLTAAEDCVARAARKYYRD